MSNQFFPDLPGLTWGVQWQPMFSTKIQTAVSGKEYRASLTANPVYQLSLSYDFLRHGAKQELRQLLGFFLARKGSFDSFLYIHPDDNAVTDQLIGVANGVKTSFQLLRGFGSEFVEPVQNINLVTNIKVNGVVKTLGPDYTVSATGMVVFGAAPTSGNVTWTGAYYYRARFAQDSLAFEKFMNNLFSAKKVEMLASLGTKI